MRSVRAKEVLTSPGWYAAKEAGQFPLTMLTPTSRELAADSCRTQARIPVIPMLPIPMRDMRMERRER